MSSKLRVYCLGTLLGLAGGGTISSVPVMAQEADPQTVETERVTFPAPVPEPPPLPERVQSGEVLEPEITIVQDEDKLVREYRVGGRVVAVRVEPKDAPAYYLWDTDNDGEIDHTRHPLGPDFLVNTWILYSW
jgi:hypothetical protein